MYLKKCFCGKSEMNFKHDIGPRYHTKCCEESGIEAKDVLHIRSEEDVVD